MKENENTILAPSSISENILVDTISFLVGLKTETCVPKGGLNVSFSSCVLLNCHISLRLEKPVGYDYSECQGLELGHISRYLTNAVPAFLLE